MIIVFSSLTCFFTRFVIASSVDLQSTMIILADILSLKHLLIMLEWFASLLNDDSVLSQE